MSKRRVTSSDVARLANVSQSAVSRAFTAGASVAPATRARILNAASELGYRPNALARAVISGRSKLIALVTPLLDNYFYAPAIQSLCRQLQDSGYGILLFMSDNDDTDEIIQRLLQYQVEGILMSGISLSFSQAESCNSAGIPVVLFNRYNVSLTATSVLSDNCGGGRLAAQFLVEGGHERIAYIAGDEDTSTNQDREKSFVDELNRHDKSLAGRELGDFTYAGGLTAARRLFSGTEIPDAVFVACDHMAFAVMDVLRSELGLSVPEQVSVIGYDDASPASWSAYDLTTITQSIDDMVSLTVETLLHQVESESLEPQSIVVPVKLTVRTSARIPPAFEKDCR